MGELTTHILDTARGVPAAGVRIDLLRGSQLLVSVVTNSAGRTDAPLLAGAALTSGQYGLAFHVGDYFRAAGVTLPEPPFLDIVTVRIGIADPNAHHHVPLLVSPWGYTTYRGG
jgi:5-hydroxyisourate hydrolase